MQMWRHLADVGMTYAEHARVSLTLARLFFQASVCAVLHALWPDAFVDSSTQTAERVAAILAHRKDG